MSLIRSIGKLHNSVAALFNYLQSPLLLAIRLYWGYQMAETGWGKLHNLPHVVEFFASLGLPFPAFMAPFVASVEFFGGILFALGLFGRVSALVLFINMTVAYWTSDREAFGHILSDPGKFYAADPYTFWFAALVVLIFGPGKLAVDTLLGRFFGISDTGFKSS